MLNSLLLKKSIAFLLPALALLTLAVYSPVLWHDFINLDDDVFVYANPFITSGVTLEGIRWAFTSSHEANWIPLSMVSHMLDVQMFGMSPVGHHAVNLLFHVASSCLLFQFFKRATGTIWQSLAVAFLFALHPLHVESVAWVAERKDVLSTFFWLLTMCAYLRYVEKPAIGRYCITLGLFVLGLLSKPMLVTLPIVLLLLDWWPLGRVSLASGSTGQTGLCRKLMWLTAEKIPFLILSACSSAITYLVQQTSGELVQGYTVLARIYRACSAYVTYLHKMVWPVDLAVLYPFSKYPLSPVKISCSVGILLFISGMVFWLRKRYPFLVMGWLWYLLTLLPVIGLIQIGQHSVADRYTYIPLTGLFVMIVWGVPQLLEKWRYREFVIGTASLIAALVLMVLTVKQLQYWKNSATLFTQTLRVTDGNWVIHNNLALVYLDQGRVDEAIWHLNESIKAKPSYGIAYQNLGVAYTSVNDYKRAIEAFTWALQLDRLNPVAHYGLGVIYLEIGRKDLAVEKYQALKDLDSELAVRLQDKIVTKP